MTTESKGPGFVDAGRGSFSREAETRGLLEHEHGHELSERNKKGFRRLVF
jgi:hypothetical protein